jgi:hypothetical protein
MSGTLLTAAEDGVLEYVNNKFYLRNDSLSIFSDTQGLYLGADQDVLLYSDGAGVFYFKPLVADTDTIFNFFGTTNSGQLKWMEDEDYFLFADDIFLGQSVYEDIRVSSGNIDRPGGSDPTWVSVQPGGSGISTYLLQFGINNYGTFTVQIPHAYKEGEDIKVHAHWTPGNRGNEENGATVGWKIDYTWANIDGTFGVMGTADLSDACDGTDWKHQMTPDVTIDGHTSAKGISSMLICNIKRTDTGTDDTWATNTSGNLPLLLEVDFHFPVDTMGSRGWGTK